MPNIFLSYRRNDSQDVAGRIYDRLAAHFGADAVFMDVDTIPYGVDFRSYLGEWVGRCDLLLAIVGDHWLTAEGTDKSKLGDPADFVTIELTAALHRQIPVVPVLVGHAKMPKASQLPEVLADFAFRNAAEVRSGRDFHLHMGHLIRAIERQFRTAERAPKSATPPRAHHPAKPSSIERPVVAGPTNLGFEKLDSVGKPVGWFNSLGFVSGVSLQYNFRSVVRSDVRAGRCLEIHRTGAGEREFGSVMQRCPAKSAIGKRLLLQAQIETQDVQKSAGMWLRIDDEQYHVFFENMSSRPIRGTTPWKTYLIEADVPEKSCWLNYGVLLVGDGLLRADNFQVLVGGSDGAWESIIAESKTAGE
jgi:hypothetical protein